MSFAECRSFISGISVLIHVPDYYAAMLINISRSIINPALGKDLAYVFCRSEEDKRFQSMKLLYVLFDFFLSIYSSFFCDLTTMHFPLAKSNIMWHYCWWYCRITRCGLDVFYQNECRKLKVQRDVHEYQWDRFYNHCSCRYPTRGK